MCYRYCGTGDPPYRRAFSNCTQPASPIVMPTERDLELMRNQAAIRVRARRRIRMVLGPVYGMSSADLPALLRAAIELEKRGIKWNWEAK